MRSQGVIMFVMEDGLGICRARREIFWLQMVFLSAYENTHKLCSVIVLRLRCGDHYDGVRMVSRNHDVASVRFLLIVAVTAIPAHHCPVVSA